MTLRILSAILLIAAFLVAFFRFPLPVFLLLIDFGLMLAVREMSRILRQFQADSYYLTYLFVLLSPWVWTIQPSLMIPFLVFGTFSICGWTVVRCRDMSRGFPSVAGNVLALIYLGLPVSLAASYHSGSAQALSDSARPLELLFVLIAVWSSDSAAYFVGRNLGRYKITPLISPKKTLEGYLAGVAAPVLIAGLLGGYLFPLRSIALLLLMGFTVGLAGILGDLFESVLKRGAGVKDSATLIPGHGGVLDRVDSLLFAVPAYFLITVLLE